MEYLFVKTTIFVVTAIVLIEVWSTHSKIQLKKGQFKEHSCWKTILLQSNQLHYSAALVDKQIGFLEQILVMAGPGNVNSSHFIKVKYSSIEYSVWNWNYRVNIEFVVEWPDARRSEKTINDKNKVFGGFENSNEWFLEQIQRSVGGLFRCPVSGQ